MRKIKSGEFVVVKEVNNRDKRINLRINIIALIIIVVCSLIAVFSVKVSFYETFARLPLLKAIVTLIGILLYFPIHELLHTAIYKVFTKEKVRLSFNAFALSSECPKGFFRRYEYVTIAIIPFLFIGVLLFFLFHNLPNDWLWLSIILQIENAAGAVSDFYTIIEVLRSPYGSIVNDDGQSLKFYKRKNNDSN